jgi:anti-sigma regulatory factor (Ser/Thr protein kinase)
MGNLVYCPFFAEEFPSRFEAMTRALDRAVAALRDRGWLSLKDEPCARLCLEEALVNAIRHGNKCDEQSNVRLELAEAADTCTIRVYDEGEGFMPDKVELPGGDQLGGRGICLMRHYMDNVHYDREAHCLAMSLRRKSPPDKGESNSR